VGALAAHRGGGRRLHILMTAVISVAARRRLNRAPNRVSFDAATAQHQTRTLTMEDRR